MPVPSPQLRPIGGGKQTAGDKDRVRRQSPTPNAGATTQPTTDGFLNAIQYYDYAPGVVYTADHVARLSSRRLRCAG